ncbi:MAG TPA: hypothetical protein VME19_10860 [Streptosporangiaceae bacterium]|nr:hypothetical protein [Streptosporangiaceae bacterium]
MGSPVISPEPAGRAPVLAGVLTQVSFGFSAATRGPSVVTFELVGYAAADAAAGGSLTGPGGPVSASGGAARQAGRRRRRR